MCLLSFSHVRSWAPKLPSFYFVILRVHCVPVLFPANCLSITFCNMALLRLSACITQVIKEHGHTMECISYYIVPYSMSSSSLFCSCDLSILFLPFPCFVLFWSLPQFIGMFFNILYVFSLPNGGWFHIFLLSRRFALHVLLPCDCVVV